MSGKYFTVHVWRHVDDRDKPGHDGLGRFNCSVVANKGEPPSLFPNFSNFRLFSPKHFQRKLWRFCGISRGCNSSKWECAGFQDFVAGGRLSARILGAAGPHFAKLRRTGSERVQRFAQVYGATGRADVHCESVVSIERILNVVYILILRKDYSIVSTAAQAGASIL